MKKLLSILMIALLFIFACENDDGTGPSSGDIPQAPEFVIPTITLPAALQMNSDTHAQTVAQYGLIASLLTSQYKSLLVPADGSNTSYSNSKWTYTWSDEDDITYKLTIEDKSSAGYEWKLFVSGTYEGIPITDILIVKGTQTKDSKANDLTMYDPVMGETGSYEWYEDADGVSNFTIVAEAYEDGVKFEVALNPDQSGEFSLYDLNGDAADTLSEQYVWNADGSGEWWEYEDGAVSDNGTW